MSTEQIITIVAGVGLYIAVIVVCIARRKKDDKRECN